MNRPENERGERVTPSDLLEYRHLHDFLGPCCLCASLQDGSPETAYTEASIFRESIGRFAGEYIAACAQVDSGCGYMGGSESGNA